MKAYKVIGPSIYLDSGVVGLNEGQAKDREHNLTFTAAGFTTDSGSVDMGAYIIEKGIQFKRGEVFYYDGDLTKGTANLLEVLAAGPEPSDSDEDPEQGPEPAEADDPEGSEDDTAGEAEDEQDTEEDPEEASEGDSEDESEPASQDKPVGRGRGGRGPRKPKVPNEN